MKSPARVAALGVIAAALAAGIWLAARGTGPDRRDLDALVTVGGDLAHDVSHPLLDLTRLSGPDEMKLGHAIDAQIRASMPIGGDPNAEAYIERLTSDLAAGVRRKEISYAAALLNVPDVNAFAVAGGRVYVTAGMLSFVENEAELASVIGHEIAHVDLRHCVERLQLEQAAGKVAPGLDDLARLGYEILQRGFSEEQELAADVGGAKLAAGDEYDPWAAVTLFERFKKTYGTEVRKPTRNPVTEAVVVLPEALGRYLATHPPPDERMAAVRGSLLADPGLWRDTNRYIGRSNLGKRLTRTQDPIAAEWLIRTQPPIAAPPAR